MLHQDLTTDEVAAALRLNKATVQRLLKQGRLHGYQIGRSWRVPVESLQQFRSKGSRAEGQSSNDMAFNRVSEFVARYSTETPPKNLEEWIRLLHDESILGSAPPLSDENMSRESIYADED